MVGVKQIPVTALIYWIQNIYIYEKSGKPCIG